MDNKKLQVIIAVSLLVFLIAIFVIGFSYKKDNLKPERNISESRYAEIDGDRNIKAIETENNVNKYYINVNDDYVSYDLNIDNTGSCILKSSRVDYTSNDEVKNTESFFALEDEEFNKIKLILDYVSERNSLNEYGEYKLYYNENDKEIEEDKKYFLDVIEAIESISLNDENAEDKTKKEYGNEILDSIINELELNITNETPAE